MNSFLSSCQAFFSELRRRNVYQVAAAYLATAFVVVQIADLAAGAFGLPDWFEPLVWTLCGLGLPVALVIGWAFEMTPKGVRRTPEAGEREPSPTDVEIPPEAKRPSGSFSGGSSGIASGGSSGKNEPAESGPFPLAATPDVWVGGSVLALLLLGSWWLVGGAPGLSSGPSSQGSASEEVGSETKEQAVAVLPFEVSGSGAETWRDGMVTALSLNLDGAGGLQAVSDRAIFAAWQRQGSSRPAAPVERSLRVARSVGAKYAVVGSATQLGEDLQLGVEVYRAGSEKRLGQVETAGPAGRITALTDRLTQKVLTLLLDRSEDQLPTVDLASVTTSSLEALKAFLEGERHLRAGRTGPAVGDFKNAIRVDSSFALPYARIGLLDLWRHESWGQYVQRAHQLSGRLPEKTRRLIETLHIGRIERRAVEATKRFRELTQDYPEDPEVWNSLGEFIAHANVPRGLPEVERAHKRAVALDPGNASYYDHYVGTAFKLHRDSVMAARRIERMPEGKEKRWYRHALKIVFGSPAERERALGRIDTLSVPQYSHQLPFEHPASLNHASAVNQKLLNREDFPARELALADVSITFSQGKRTEATRLLGRYEETGKIRGGMPAFIMSVESTLLPLPEAGRYLAPKNSPTGQRFPMSVYASGIHLVNRDKYRRARSLIQQYRAAVDTVEAPPARKAAARRAADGVEGYQAYRAGNLQEARQLLEGTNQTGDHGAILRGDLYRKLRNWRKAEGWYQAGWEHPVAHERLGKLYEEMRRPEEAIAAYRRFAKAWEEADSGLQSRVEKAESRIEALEAKLAVR